MTMNKKVSIMVDYFVYKNDFRIWLFVNVYDVITTSRQFFIHANMGFCNVQYIYILKRNVGNLYHLHNSELLYIIVSLR